MRIHIDLCYKILYLIFSMEDLEGGVYLEAINSYWKSVRDYSKDKGITVKQARTALKPYYYELRLQRRRKQNPSPYWERIRNHAREKGITIKQARQELKGVKGNLNKEVDELFEEIKEEEEEYKDQTVDDVKELISSSNSLEQK